MANRYVQKSKEMLAFAKANSIAIDKRSLDLFIELECAMISQRTREALARAKAEGRSVGRPLGRKNASTKLAGRADAVRQLMLSGCTKSEAARRLGVHRETLAEFMKKLSESKIRITDIW